MYGHRVCKTSFRYDSKITSLIQDLPGLHRKENKAAGKRNR